MDNDTTPTEQSEEWRAVAGFENYEVSDLGRIRRITAKGYRNLRPGRNVSGHLTIGLRDAEGKSRWRYMHRLVLTAFRGEPAPGMFGCHYDDDPSNNRLDNLRWDTRKANGEDATRNRKIGKPINVAPIHIRDKWSTTLTKAAQHHNLILERVKALHDERAALLADLDLATQKFKEEKKRSRECPACGVLHNVEDPANISVLRCVECHVSGVDNSSSLFMGGA